MNADARCDAPSRRGRREEEDCGRGHGGGRPAPNHAGRRPSALALPDQPHLRRAGCANSCFHAALCASRAVVAGLTCAVGGCRSSGARAGRASPGAERPPCLLFRV
eukprot:565302-Rhodomonas_salina.2